MDAPLHLEPSRAFFRQLLAVVEKELRSEFRQRVGIAVTVLSVTTVGLILSFALQGITLSEELFAALLWLLFFFSLSPAMGRSFLTEEERGTRLLLYTLTLPAAVYWGKLSANILLGGATSGIGYALVSLILSPPPIRNPLGLTIVVGAIAIGFAAALTLLSALIATARHRNLLLPILGLPLLIPLLLSGIAATLSALRHPTWNELLPPLKLMLAYSGATSIVGSWLFEWVWRE